METFSSRMAFCGSPRSHGKDVLRVRCCRRLGDPISPAQRTEGLRQHVHFFDAAPVHFSAIKNQRGLSATIIFEARAIFYVQYHFGIRLKHTIGSFIGKAALQSRQVIPPLEHSKCAASVPHASTSSTRSICSRGGRDEHIFLKIKYHIRCCSTISCFGSF